jgi:hypothetical protein
MSPGARQAILVVLLLLVAVGLYLAYRTVQPGGVLTGVVSGQQDGTGGPAAATSSGADTGPEAPAPQQDAPGTTPALKAPPPAFPPGTRPAFVHARFEPVRDVSGTPLGLRVLSVLPNGILARLQIRAGDIIQSVNGVHFDKPETFDKAVALAEEAFLANTLLYVRIKRGDESFALANMGAADPDPADPLGEAGQPE